MQGALANEAIYHHAFERDEDLARAQRRQTSVAHLAISTLAILAPVGVVLLGTLQLAGIGGAPQHAETWVTDWSAKGAGRHASAENSLLYHIRLLYRKVLWQNVPRRRGLTGSRGCLPTT